MALVLLKIVTGLLLWPLACLFVALVLVLVFVGVPIYWLFKLLLFRTPKK